MRKLLLLAFCVGIIQIPPHIQYYSDQSWRLYNLYGANLSRSTPRRYLSEPAGRYRQPLPLPPPLVEEIKPPKIYFCC